MIVYIDTSALVPLIVTERTSGVAETLWDAAERLIATPLVRTEAHAALAQAHRIGRIATEQLHEGLANLAMLGDQLDSLEIARDLAVVAGEVAERHRLRAYDAVHLAAALTLGDPTVVFATGDRRLAAAARDAGLAVAELTPGIGRKVMLALGVGVYGDLRGDSLDLRVTRHGRTEMISDIILQPTPRDTD